eukprot:CAMPEP_0202901442 /NCGR_PEP_ID=MMETSP1392-20130828/14253_1 /ASSEMBLY_ACC=CAM_ASM_000868 /TAXON_ID=225041 /ORGANISM="Chlamydomonas chlamydogama, Strain SAG 11-48b" /LENGTH=475 /DNA_ID=CAMNT_0049587999 /DNA_START=68 /DNA_END=1495 /DNA_ORIENTATION=+
MSHGLLQRPRPFGPASSVQCHRNSSIRNLTLGRKGHVRPFQGLARSSDKDPQGTEGPPSDPSSSPASTSEQQQQPSVAVVGEDGNLQLPKEVIDRIKFTVFGFDTFWVTSVENYKADGVVFKGNMRGKDPYASYEKMRDRMKTELGEDYQLFLLEDQEDKPTAVVLPKTAANEGTISKVTEVWLTVLFAGLTLITTANSNGVPLLQFLIDPFRTPISTQDFLDALPGALAFFFALGAHEWGHQWAAKRRGLGTYYPLFVPAGFGFLGSFGAITRIRGFVPNREALLDFAASGPLVGTGVAGAITFLGFVLSSLGVTDVSIDSSSFADSFFMAVAAQAFLGDDLVNPVVQVNSLLVAGWAALVVNSLNLIPAGELDGGRIALAVWGRKSAGVLSIATLGTLALTSLASSLSFYWIGLVLFLQRGPVLPCSEELGAPKDDKAITAGLALLALPLLVLAPYPIELVLAMQEMSAPVPF